jgi:prevent-host-death family protein
MRIVNVTEAKAQLSRLLEEAERGETVVIGRAGRPVAVLTAYDADTTQRLLDAPWRGQVEIAEDFDELPDDVLTAFRGESG